MYEKKRCFMKYMSFMTFALLITFSGIAANASADTNLILNPGFESGSSTPLNWNLITKSDNSPYWDTVAHSGERSIRIQIKGTSDVISGFPISDITTAQPATSYTFSAWGKSQGTLGTVNPAVRIEELDSNKKLLQQTDLHFSQGTYDWTQKQIDFRTLSNTAYIDVYINIWGGYGTFWADDIEFKLKSAVPASPQTLNPTVTLTTTPDTTPLESDGSGVIINPDKTVSINGKKTFPLMMSALCDSYKTSPSQCLTNLQANPYDIDGIGNSDITDSTLQSHVTTGKYFMSGAGTFKFKNHPNFFGYYLSEEPSDSEHQKLVDKYTKIKKEDPNHVVITGIWKEAEKWLKTSDIVIAGLYPFKKGFIKEYGSRDRAIYGYETVVRNNLGIDNFDSIDKPVWPIIQSLSGTDSGGVLPISAKELRALQYTAITMNVKGLSYYQYSYTYDITPNVALITDQTMVDMYANAAKEIKSLNDILVLPTEDYSWEYRKGSQVSFSKTLNLDMWWLDRTNFNYMLKHDGNTWYLIVVNKDIRPISDVVITINGLSGLMTATTIGLPEAGSVPGRTVSVNNGKFTDNFDGYGVKIYKIT